MSGRRAAAVGAVSAALLVAFAPSAHACNEPEISATPTSPGPGDTVSWTIAPIDQGAHYTVRLGGSIVGSGTSATQGSLSGQFTMPDLGDQKVDVTLESAVEHSSGDAGHSDGIKGHYVTLHYTPPTPPPAQERPADQPAADEAPAARPAPQGDSAPSPPATVDAPTAAAPTQGAAPQRTRADAPRRSARRPADRRQPARTRATAPVSRVVAPATTAVPAPLRRLEQGPAAVRRSERAGSRRPRLDQRPVPRRIEGPAPGVTLRAASAPRATSAGSPPVPLIAGVLALTAGLGLLLLLRGRPPAEPEPAVLPQDGLPPAGGASAELEAALQELVSEHRARELLGDRAPVPSED